MSVTRKCRTTLGALNRRFKWEFEPYIRFARCDHNSIGMSNSHYKRLGSKGLEVSTNTPGNALRNYSREPLALVLN